MRPQGNRATENESIQAHFGIPESIPPDGGKTFIVNLHAPTSDRTTMKESSQAHLAYLNLCRLTAARLS
jgi:hypothetical protein